MLSYQHAYHAGNFADMHKHVGLMLLIEKMTARPQPLVYFDTHAGRGMYDLTSKEAVKTGEFAHGIAALEASGKTGPILGRYLALLGRIREKYGANAYPGSPALAREMLRASDRMVLGELHPQEIVHLKETFREDRVEIRRQDAMNGLNAMLPPSVRRGIVLIDPSFEIKTEYAELPGQMTRALRRWPSGVYMIWYPILPDARHLGMVDGLRKLPGADVMVSELMAPEAIAGHRMQGSGLVIFNAPSKFKDDMTAAGKELCEGLFAGQGSHTIS